MQHILALHRLSDLRAAGDDGSRQQRLAQGLLADASTTVVYRQHAQEVPDTADALGLSSTARDRIATLPAGVALWSSAAAASRSATCSQTANGNSSTPTPRWPRAPTPTAETEPALSSGRAAGEHVMSGRTHAGADLAALAVAVVLATPLAIVWLASLTAGQLASGHALQLSLPGALGVLERLPDHLGTPRLAWPAPVRSQLPGSVVLDAVLFASGAVVLGLLAGAVILALRFVHHRDRDRAARWASEGELGRCGWPGPSRDGSCSASTPIG